jgi:hypothetical protein
MTMIGLLDFTNSEFPPQAAAPQADLNETIARQQPIKLKEIINVAYDANRAE